MNLGKAEVACIGMKENKRWIYGQGNKKIN